MGNSKPSKQKKNKPKAKGIAASRDSLAIPRAPPKHASAGNADRITTMPTSKVELHYVPFSPPCRSVMLLAKVIEVDLDLKLCNLQGGEHLKPDFIGMNPQHTVPTMNDKGLVIWESRAIMGYLVNQYASNDNMYPEDPKARARVDHVLYFDNSTLSPRIASYYAAFTFRGVTQTPENLKAIEEALGWLNTMLEGHTFAAGDHLTIADIALVASVSDLDAYGFDLSGYPNVLAWYAKTKQELAPFGYEEINQKGAEAIAGFYKGKLSQG